MPTTRKFCWLVIAFGIVLTVVGVRWSVIDRYGMDLPENDQWDAEGLHALLPWLQQRPLLPELLTPHNEHYVVLTKLLNLGLTLAGGQWDQRVENAFNAFLPATLALGMFLWSRCFLPARAIVPACALITAAWALPLSWQNVIAGFHSQQYFLLVLSFVTIVWLPFATPSSVRWWLGALAAAGALLSMASGFFASAIVVGMIVLRLALKETTLRQALPSAILAMILTLVGWLARHEVYYHQSLKAANVHDFTQTILRSLQWPAPGSRWFGLLLWLPWVWQVGSLLRRRTANPWRVHGWIIAGLGGWVWLQLLATAYARGAGGPPPAVRYVDTLVFACLVNALALGWLARQRFAETSSPGAGLVHPSNTAWSKSCLALLTIAWLTLAGWGGFREIHNSFRSDFPQARDYEKKAVARTRAYLATGDIAYLDDPEIPYPSAGALVERITRPELAALLPVSVRRSIAIEPAAGSQGFELSANLQALPSGTRGPFGLVLGMTNERFSTTPPLHRRTWSSFASRGSAEPRSWSSAPLTLSTTGGRLLFAVVGDPRSKIELVDAQSAEVLSTINPKRLDLWKTAVVSAPSRPFFIRATEDNSSQWIAFSEPVFMSTISYFAWSATAHGSTVAFVGILAILGCSIGIWLGGRKSRSASREGPSAEDAARLDEEFYRSKSWGAVPIRTARDLPSLKLRYLMDLLNRRSNRAARLLEVGSGSGRILSSIRQRDADLHLTGIDLSAEQTELARSTHRDIDFVCGNGESLPFPDNSFDYVIFFDYLEHIERPRQSLAEIQRVLKPGGYLHLVCPAERQSIYGLSSKLFGRHFKEETAGHIQQFSRRDLDSLVEATGLSIVDRRYSYHLLGSLMDYTLFTLMLHPRIYAIYWSGNPYYAKSETQAKSGFFQRVLRSGNAIAFFESTMLSKVSFSAAAVHLTAQKTTARSA